MKNKKIKKTIMTVYVKDGVLSERNPFENALKWDSPTVVRALNNKLKGSKK